LNSDQALAVVESLIGGGKVSRVSPASRTTKAIIFCTASGRNFAVEINPVQSTSTKLVFERTVGGVPLEWEQIGRIPGVTPVDRQFKSSALKVRGANLEDGKQMSALVAHEAALASLLDWYANAARGWMLRYEDVEAAMDRYDALDQQVTAAGRGAGGDWLLPSSERLHRRYPCVAIAVLATGAPEVKAGWAAPDSASALLYNAGYFIVDDNGLPVQEPVPRGPHLIPVADRIRACALTNYIAPARRSGAASVAIRAGTLHDQIGLSRNWANVCQALQGPKFLALAAVAPPQVSGPDASTTTTFTYSLDEQAIMPVPLPVMPTTNLILYGPPGTGKTYTTAQEAVRLCLGEPAVAAMDREDLMEAYRQLVEEGRIDFVTFHQSYSYEDFVEGLRPTTDAVDASGDDEEEVAASQGAGGFRLVSRDGIFKRICERARLDPGEGGDQPRLDRQRPIFKMALGRKHIEEDRIDEGLQRNLIHLGWGGKIDWSDERFFSFEAIRREWHDNVDAGASGKDPNIEMTYAFRSSMQVGDYVVLSDGRDTFRAFGVVEGDYFYDANAPFHPHRRKVRWLWQNPEGVERNTFYRNLFRRQSVYRLNMKIVDWDALEAIVLDQAVQRPTVGSRSYVLVIDEINRANISKVFGELITLLEPDKRLGQTNELRVKLPYSDSAPFGVPANLHIIGTMNTADRSIALLDTALRRRFAFRELMPDPGQLRTVDGVNLAELLATINERIEYLFDREHQIGHAYFINCARLADIEEVMRHKVIPLLAEYFYEDWGKVAAVLGDGDDGESDRAGAFLDRKRLAAPKGLGVDGDAEVRFRWSVREKFDFSKLVRG